MRPRPESYLGLCSLCIAICLHEHDIDHKTKVVTRDTRNGDSEKNEFNIQIKADMGQTSAQLQLKSNFFHSNCLLKFNLPQKGTFMPWTFFILFKTYGGLFQKPLYCP
jgi:hypothetical protein